MEWLDIILGPTAQILSDLDPMSRSHRGQTVKILFSITPFKIVIYTGATKIKT